MALNFVKHSMQGFAPHLLLRIEKETSCLSYLLLDLQSIHSSEALSMLLYSAFRGTFALHFNRDKPCPIPYHDFIALVTHQPMLHGENPHTYGEIVRQVYFSL